MTTPSVPSIPELAERLREAIMETMPKDRAPEDRNEAADKALTALEAMADHWADHEISLAGMIENVVSVSRLRHDGPPEEREALVVRQAENIDALIRMAFVEGAYRGFWACDDEQRSALEELSCLKAGEGEGFAAELRQQATDWHDAVHGEGPRAFYWTDKPHRELIEATKELRRAADEIDRLRALPPAPGGRSMTTSKIADPLLPEQIAEMRAKFIAAHDGPAWQFPALWEEFQTALAPLLGKLLSAAERGIAAGEVVARAEREQIAATDAMLKAEADLAASNARIGEARQLALSINALTSAGTRTFDEMIRDTGYANDLARSLLALFAEIK